VWLLLLAILAGEARGWQESDFPPRPVVGYPFSVGSTGELATVIGLARSYTFQKGDTLYDVARHLGLGINEVIQAFPDLDVWLPTEGMTLRFPTWWILPDSDYQGVVINIPEMRLYYFPPHRDSDPSTVITYAVGLGRDDWRTPIGRFKVREKTVNPEWVIPDSIREERIREKGRHEKVIRGGDPDNPLGRYRLRLTLPLYGIHGTNIAWGVGMQVSHGCVRLYPEDIDRLFPMVPIGTAGEFVYQPVKIGARQGRVYIEVHPDIYNLGSDFWNEAREQLRERGWESYVDWGLVADALDRRSGVPTRISHGRPLSGIPDDGPDDGEEDFEPEVSEAAHHAAEGAKVLKD
jgi:L,D-transpeptidase ErfK/SrfK